MELYAIRYGKKFKYGTRGTVFQGDKHPDEPMENFSFFYYLAEYDGRYLLFDTGFREQAMAADMGVLLLPVAEEIKAVFGGMPEIHTIVLTHSHWDHADNLDLYPGAGLVMPAKTREILSESGTEPVKQRLTKSVITTVEEDYVLMDKFRLQVIGGHMPDSSVVFFEEGGTDYVITGDECYVCDNIIRNIPIGICTDAAKNAEFIRMAHEKGLVPLPFHDVSLLTRYPRLSENIVRVI